MKSSVVRFLLLWIMIVIASGSIAQTGKKDIFSELLQKDSLLFHAAFTSCNVVELEKILASDFEFYQQNSGAEVTTTTNRIQFLKNIKDNFCSPAKKPGFSMRRKLLKETVSMSSIGNYGIVQTGLQEFYMTENKKEQLVEVSKFTRLWKQEDGKWMLVRESDQKLTPDSKELAQISNNRSYSPVDKQLYNTIVNLDSVLFDAYNNCKMEVSEALYSDSIEFFHDRGGLSNSKQGLMTALKNNICDKVTRHLKPNSIEVSPIPGYGAVEIGEHGFKNKQEPDAPFRYSRFVILWQYKNEKWQLTKVISLH